jgi:hypothetical protein
MQDGANEPTTVPAPPPPVKGPASRTRAVVLLAIGGSVGLPLGVLLTTAVTTTYTFVTQTVPSTRESVEVFNQLNEMRQQINQLNEEKKLKDQEKEEAVQKALSAVAAAAHAPESKTSDAEAPAKKEASMADARPVAKPQNEFAELDEEIERLEHTEKVLNNILDLFSHKGKAKAKEPEPPAARKPDK